MVCLLFIVCKEHGFWVSWHMVVIGLFLNVFW